MKGIVGRGALTDKSLMDGVGSVVFQDSRLVFICYWATRSRLKRAEARVSSTSILDSGLEREGGGSTCLVVPIGAVLVQESLGPCGFGLVHFESDLGHRVPYLARLASDLASFAFGLARPKTLELSHKSGHIRIFDFRLLRSDYWGRSSRRSISRPGRGSVRKWKLACSVLRGVVEAMVACKIISM